MQRVATPMPPPLRASCGHGAGEAGAGGAERVAEGNHAVLQVENCRVELGPFGHAAQHVGGEDLVQVQD